MEKIFTPREIAQLSIQNATPEEVQEAAAIFSEYRKIAGERYAGDMSAETVRLFGLGAVYYAGFIAGKQSERAKKRRNAAETPVDAF